MAVELYGCAACSCVLFTGHDVRGKFDLELC